MKHKGKVPRRKFIAPEPSDDLYRQAASEIISADYVMIASGAGLSADSGLGVYKDINEIKAYKERDMEYVDISQIRWLEEDREFFYGFWGYSFNEYSKATPHRGYEILKEWRDTIFSSDDKLKCFVYTSNVDGLFAKVGFDKEEILQIHGCALNWHCSNFCSDEMWTYPEGFAFDVDEDTMLAHYEEPYDHYGRIDYTDAWKNNHPRCKWCHRAYARPNVMMFADMDYLVDRRERDNYNEWNYNVLRDLQGSEKKLVIIEIGAGVTVPSVRMNSEQIASNTKFDTCLIRINLDYHHVPEDIDAVPLKGKSLDVLERLDQEIKTLLKE